MYLHFLRGLQGSQGGPGVTTGTHTLQQSHGGFAGGGGHGFTCTLGIPSAKTGMQHGLQQFAGQVMLDRTRRGAAAASLPQVLQSILPNLGTNTKCQNFSNGRHQTDG
jgi:hypothetical protein